MDTALAAIAFSFLLILFATIVGYTEGDSLDTISDMITRTPQLRNAFAVFVTLMIIAQWYYCSEMIKRWRACGQNLRVLSVAIYVCMVASFAGAFGFAINSTDVAEQEHLYFAAVSFIGTWGYIAIFCYIAWQANVSLPSAFGALLGFLLATLSLIALAPQTSWKHFAEYVFVFSIHLTAACLCITTDHHPCDFQPVDMQILTFSNVPMVQQTELMIEIKTKDNSTYTLTWVDPGCQWSKLNQIGFFDVIVSCVNNMTYDKKKERLFIYGQNKKETDTVDVEEKEMRKFKQLNLPFELKLI